MRKRLYTHNVGVMFDEGTYQKIVRFTDAKESPISAFIRDLVEDYIDLQEKQAQFDEEMLDYNTELSREEKHHV